MSADTRPEVTCSTVSTFLPGSTARGAAAWGWTRQGLPEADVSELILRRTRFSHLYPVQLDEIRPSTAVACKQQPDKDGPFDTLLLRFLLNQAEKTANGKALISLFERLDACPNCKGGLIPADRFKTSADRQLMIKLGLNRQTGHAKETFFYIYETLNSQTTYSGFLQADESIEALPETVPVFIGGARGKGFGKGTLKIHHDVSHVPGDLDAVKERLKQLNRKLEELAAEKMYALALPRIEPTSL